MGIALNNPFVVMYNYTLPTEEKFYFQLLALISVLYIFSCSITRKVMIWSSCFQGNASKESFKQSLFGVQCWTELLLENGVAVFPLFQ